MTQTINQLAADPGLRAQIAQIPRDVSPARVPRAKSMLPSVQERMNALNGGMADPEMTLAGALARIALLEKQVTKLMRER